jgi:pyrophosphatase PpaX
MPGFNTMLFDFDGTVIDSSEAVLLSWQYTLKKYTGKEADPDLIFSTYGEQLDTTLKRLLPDVPTDEALRTYRNFQEGKVEDKIKLFPGMKDTIEKCRDIGYKVGLVTSRHRETTLMLADRLGIKDDFDVIVASEDTEKHKPDPAPVNKALSSLCSIPEESLMVGDAVFDMKCAHNAGVRFALVGWSVSISRTKDFGGETPEYIIGSPDELPYLK